MSTIALFFAYIFEILWVTLLAQLNISKSFTYFLLITSCMALSLYLLGFASKDIPIALGYAVWVGLGVMGQALVQHFFFAEYLTLSSWFFMVILVFSIFGLLFSQSHKGTVY